MKYSTYLLGIIYLGLAFSALVYARPVLRGHPDDWPQWRGPNRDGISAEKGILKSWDDSGPETIWRVASGDGYAGIAVANGRLFTAWGGGRSAYLVCYDAATGKQLWKTKLGANSFLDQGNGPRATPLVDGDLVYMIDGFAKLFAVRAQSGDVAWQRDLEREYGSRVPRWGYSSSPMVLGDKLIVTVGGKSDYAYMAFNKANGAEIWHAGNDEPGYSSPILVTIAGTQHVAQGLNDLLLVELDGAGAPLWSRSFGGGQDRFDAGIDVCEDRLPFGQGFGLDGGAQFGFERLLVGQGEVQAAGAKLRPVNRRAKSQPEFWFQRTD